MFYDQDEDDIQKVSNIEEGPIEKGKNLYVLTEDHRNNLCKRLPRGFCLIKQEQYNRLDYRFRKDHIDFIDYQPVKKERQIEIDNPLIKTFDSIWNQNKEEDSRRNRITLQPSLEGKSRQGEKIKNIIQRFRKLIKNSLVQAFLNKIGYMDGLNSIEVENKRGLLSIDTFKRRYLTVLEEAKKKTYEADVSAQLQEMIQEFACFVEQARKAEFENNIQSIQKSIDKITRYLSDANDGKTQANWYIRKKKKIERNDNCSQKEILYFGDLIKRLPTAYLVGVWEIINERPFGDIQNKIEKVSLYQIGNKKLREIEAYVKGKLTQLYRSRERKRQKILIKRGGKIEEKKYQNENEQNEDEIVKEQNGQQYDDELIIPDFLKKSSDKVQNKDEEVVPNESQAEEFKVKEEQNKSNNDVANQQVKFEDQRNNQNNADEAKQNIEEDSMDEQNSSDSSMITDEDESDF